MWTVYTSHCYYTSGKASSRLFELGTEISSLLNDRNGLLTDYFNDKEWLCTLYYLAYIFHKMNKFSTFIQGKRKTTFDANDKVVEENDSVPQ